MMHIKRLTIKDGRWFIEHFKIINAIDGSEVYYTPLKSFFEIIKYLPKIIKHYIKNID